MLHSKYTLSLYMQVKGHIKHKEANFKITFHICEEQHKLFSQFLTLLNTSYCNHFEH